MTPDGWARDRRGWYVRDDGTSYRIARRLPAVWDVSATTRLPDLGRRRLAHAVRQDLWRMLQRLRGFAPMVCVTRDAEGTVVRAGGQVAGRVPATTHDRIAALLRDPGTRAAWTAAARHR